MFYNDFESELEFLLDKGAPSIKYLVRRDYMDCDRSSPDMLNLQAMIFEQPNIKKLLTLQHADGWLGCELHGNNGFDCIITKLLDSGIEPDNQVIARAVSALTDSDIMLNHKSTFRGGDALDADGRGGNRAVVAKILARAGYSESKSPLRDEISLAWEHIFASSSYSSVDDFTIKSSGKRYYKPCARFPGANHIELLGLTHTWQTADRLDAARRSVANCYRLMCDIDEQITFKKPREFGGGFVGPFNFDWHSLSPLTPNQIVEIMRDDYNYKFAFWLRNLTNTPRWAMQSTESYESLAELVKSGELVRSIPDKTFRAFHQVFGIEPNLGKKAATECELLYCALRAIHSALE